MNKELHGAGHVCYSEGCSECSCHNSECDCKFCCTSSLRSKRNGGRYM